jgi:hypothetical protein
VGLFAEGQRSAHLPLSMNQYRPEQLIRRAVFEHLRLRAAPVAFFFHVPNGGYHKPIEAAIMKGLGVKAGVPDIIVVHRGRCYAVELKAAGGSHCPLRWISAWRT